MLRIALTGGIASGKSAAAAIFQDLGVPVIDTDKIARDVVVRGTEGLTALVDEFGADVLTESGDLDRSRLRERIFASPTSRERVNAILHPLILAEVDQRLQTLQTVGKHHYAIVEVPLLTETRLASRFDRVLVIDVPEHVQMQRLEARDGVDRRQAKAALAAQAGRQDRLRLATDVIDNSGDLDALRQKVADAHERFMALAKGFATSRNGPAE